MWERLNGMISRWLFVLLLGAIAVGGWQAPLLAPVSYLSPYLLAVVIFAVASTLDVKAFQRAGRRVGLWARSFALSYTLFPLLGWAAGQLLFPADPLIRAGLLLLSLVPAANTCSVYTGLGRGDVAFALTGIALGNLLLPLLLMLFFGLGEPGVSPVAMWRTLGGFVILPTAAGLGLGNWIARRPGGPAAPAWERHLSPLLARLGVTGIMLLNAAALRMNMEWHWGKVLLLAAVITAIEGTMYAVTVWWSSRRVEDEQEGRALSFLHGTRNTALAIALASSLLDFEAALPAMVAFLVQEPLAAAVAAGFARRGGQEEPMFPA